MPSWYKGGPLPGRIAGADDYFDVEADLRARTAKYHAAILAKYPKLPADWHERLPAAETYYRHHVRTLGGPNARGWARGRCPFHGGKRKSLAVHYSGGRGMWACLAGCGMGDMIEFHERVTGHGFELAVLDLLGIPA